LFESATVGYFAQNFVALFCQYVTNGFPQREPPQWTFLIQLARQPAVLVQVASTQACVPREAAIWNTRRLPRPASGCKGQSEKARGKGSRRGASRPPNSRTLSASIGVPGITDITEADRALIGQWFMVGARPS
jgi:hypothetical protein